MKFIILSAGRTGTTLLLMALEKHPDVFIKGEAMKSRELEEDGRSYEEQVDYIFEIDHGVEAKGCKLFFHHLHHGDPRWEWYKQNTFIIHSTRLDYLDWYVSMVTARKNNEWNRKNPDQVASFKERRVSVNIEHMKKSIAKYKEHIAWAREWAIPERYVEIDYSDMVSDWPGTIQKVQNALEIERIDLPQRCVKINPEPLSERIVNWEEVKGVDL